MHTATHYDGRECGVCRRKMAEFGALYACRTVDCLRHATGVCAECTVMRHTPHDLPTQSHSLKPSLMMRPWAQYVVVAVTLLTLLVIGAVFNMCFAQHFIVWVGAIGGLLCYGRVTWNLSNNPGRWNSGIAVEGDNLRARWSTPRRCCAICQQELPPGTTA